MHVLASPGLAGELPSRPGRALWCGAAREKAKSTREEADEAQKDLEALEAEKEQLRNLSEEDQGAIQDATQGGIDLRR